MCVEAAARSPFLYLSYPPPTPPNPSTHQIPPARAWWFWFWLGWALPALSPFLPGHFPGGMWECECVCVCVRLPPTLFIP